MGEVSKTSDVENLRKVVEAIDEIADDDQIQAPELNEVAEELGVSGNTVSRWTGRDYNHAVRTAGLIPRTSHNIGDYMEVYNKLNDSDSEITKQVMEEDSPVSPLGQTDKKITHNQAREKIGLDPNFGFMHYAPEKIYGEEGSNFEHKLRGLILEFMDENDRPPSNSELNNRINFKEGDKIQESKERADLYVEPIKPHRTEIMSGDREDEVFDFWVSEYLEEDWSQYDDTEVDTIMKLRMTEEDISENELNAVASQYSKWIDFDGYQSK
jgi:hypothetical protein